jgi:hypothetical protein
MRIETHEVLPAALLEEAWQVYAEAFDELRVRAVQRHVMPRHEFDDQMRDPRIRKYVGVDDDRFVALGTLTNDFDAAPLISPDFFQHRWPALFAQRQIWCVGFYAIPPAHQGTGMFPLMIEEMVQIIAPGLAVVDFCGRNENVLRLPDVVLDVLENLGEVTPERLDTQAYWSYEFPAAS